MLRTNFNAIFAVAICVAVSAAAQDITPAERTKAERYLADTRNGVVEATKGLSEAQWKFKPSPDRWSVAEVVEHLALLEDYFTNGIRPQIMKAPVGGLTQDAKQVDAIILAMIPDRTSKFQAPEPIQPTGRWTPQETLDRYLASRVQTVSFLKTSTDLRGHVFSHPVFGPMDGYEWVLAIAAHTERHTKQILEVKADPNFPSGGN
jgi:hypothetical protein